MKKILITGTNSYVGDSFENWISKWKDKYTIDRISVRNETWKKHDFSKYDIVVHLAAVVHKKESKEKEVYYNKINRDLTKKIALKAKKEGIKQFIFMSSLSVYGVNGNINRKVIIDKHTQCTPNTLYGKSKLEAESELKSIENKEFRIAIIRAPMIYGPNCPGNYTRLKKLVMKTPIFPYVENQRSMIFIDNLSEFIRILIDQRTSGLFHPQNKEYVNTADLVKLIAETNCKNVILSKNLALVIKILGSRVNILNKVFGDLIIDKSLSSYEEFNYSIVDFRRSIELSEGN